MERNCEHGCKRETCPPDGGHDVSCRDDANFWLMAGPYPTHATALADVDEAPADCGQDRRAGVVHELGYGAHDRRLPQARKVERTEIDLKPTSPSARGPRYYNKISNTRRMNAEMAKPKSRSNPSQAIQ